MNFHGECGSGGIPTDYWDEDEIREYLDMSWAQEVWQTSDMVVSRDAERGLMYGRKAIPSDYTDGGEIIKDGWDHAHCSVCSWKIMTSDDPLVGVGFRNEEMWLCVKCYHSLFGQDR